MHFSMHPWAGCGSAARRHHMSPHGTRTSLVHAQPGRAWDVHVGRLDPCNLAHLVGIKNREIYVPSELVSYNFKFHELANSLLRSANTLDLCRAVHGLHRNNCATHWAFV